jgi:hypothetical protein
VLGVLMAEVVHSIVNDRMVRNTAEAAILLTSGHTYACGVVSPQIIALAQSGARALANAKIRFAATLAIFAGGAAAAGAQVVSQVSTWQFPASLQIDVAGFLRNLIPSRPPRLVEKDRPPTKPGGDSVADNSVAPRPAAPNDAAPKPPASAAAGHGGWIFDWSVPRIVPPAVFDPPAYANQRNGGSPVAPLAPLYHGPANSGAVAPEPRLVNGPSRGTSPNTQGVGNGGGGSRNGVEGGGNADANANGDGGGSGGGVKAPRPERVATDKQPKPQSLPPQTPPGRGGVKPRPNDDVANDGSPRPRGVRGGTDQAQHHQVPQVIPSPPLPPVLVPQINPPITPPVIDAGGVAPHGDPVTELPPAAPPPPARVFGGTRTGDFLDISTPFNPDGTESFDALFPRAPGPSNFQMGDGDHVQSPQVVIGYQGAGLGQQAGGLHEVTSLYLGVTKTGRGMYQLTGGELRVAASPAGPDSPVHSIEVGGAGEAIFYLGNLDTTGIISQTAGGGVDLTVGGIRTAVGTLRGWGDVRLTGRLANNGQIVADGYGQNRVLDLSTFATVGNAFQYRGGKGWYAVNHGRLALPALHVAPGTNTYTWGNAADDDLSLVNSARLTFHDATGEGVVKIALLALDRNDIPQFPAGHTVIGVWEYDQSGFAAPGGTDLLVRYDDALAAARGLDENVLKLWKHDVDGWHRLDFDESFVRDPDNHTLFVHTGMDGVNFFAVSAPEPGTAGLLAGGIAVLLTRRRRRT